MLGMKRWADLVLHNDDLPKAIRQYIGSAEPTDDITLMKIRKKTAVEPLTVQVENRMDRWPVLRAALHDYGLCAGMDSRTLKKTEVAIEEAVVNIVNYSQSEWMELEVSVQRPTTNDQRLLISLRDNGIAFDPTQLAEVDTAQVAAARQVGGLGIALLRKIADEVRYQRIDGVNELTILKQI